jgi:hypothetical protein
MSNSSVEIRDIVQQFVARVSTLIEQDAIARAREAVLSAFGAAAPGPARRGPGRPPGSGKAATGKPARRARRKGPIQMCPVPGCGNRAAPVFGMVCAKHKNLPKATVKKYREQRRARKAAGKA